MKGIYIIHDKINNKNYIGQTKDFKRRRKEHKKELRQGKHHSKKMQETFDRYGFDAFEMKIIVENDLLTDNEMDLLEIKYIKEFGTFENGYNSTLGGKGRKGVPISKENRQSLNEGIRRGYKEGTIKSPFKGKHHSEKNKKFFKESQQGDKSKLAKLTLTQGIEIKLLALRDKKTNVEISKMYGNITPTTVSRIKTGKRWGNLPNDVKELENMLISSQANESHKSN